MLRIVEKFKSIQTEGKHAGTPATFIRLFGCNLQCDFGDGLYCDESKHEDKSFIVKHTEMETIKYCEGIRHVVITGGEPSLQDLNEFILELQNRGHYVQIETNGTNIDNIKSADWITYSPKHLWDDKAPRLGSRFHELKLLASEKNPPNVEEWHSVKNKYIQPIGLADGWDMNNVKWCAEWLLHNRGWKLSLQTHKIIGLE